MPKPVSNSSGPNYIEMATIKPAGPISVPRPISEPKVNTDILRQHNYKTFNNLNAYNVSWGKMALVGLVLVASIVAAGIFGNPDVVKGVTISSGIGLGLLGAFLLYKGHSHSLINQIKMEMEHEFELPQGKDKYDKFKEFLKNKFQSTNTEILCDVECYILWKLKDIEQFPPVFKENLNELERRTTDKYGVKNIEQTTDIPNQNIGLPPELSKRYPNIVTIAQKSDGFNKLENFSWIELEEFNKEFIKDNFKHIDPNSNKFSELLQKMKKNKKCFLLFITEQFKSAKKDPSLTFEQIDQINSEILKLREEIYNNYKEIPKDSSP